MKIIDEELLDEFRGAGHCEVCDKLCLWREAHHIFAKGLGGGGRLDVRVNLISVGKTKPFPCCPCHGLIHQGKIKRDTLLLIVSEREGVSVSEIEEIIFRLRRTPKT